MLQYTLSIPTYPVEGHSVFWIQSKITLGKRQEILSTYHWRVETNNNSHSHLYCIIQFTYDFGMKYYFEERKKKDSQSWWQIYFCQPLKAAICYQQPLIPDNCL